MKSALLVLVLAIAGCSAAPAPVPFTLLQANVGNTLLRCGDNYVYKLCQVEVEDHIRDEIAALAPDVIALQEVLPDGACDAFTEDDPAYVCHPDHTHGDPSQIHRLLGDAYAWVCDDRHGYECVAAKRGSVDLANVYKVAPPVVVNGTACDSGFSVGLVQVTIAGAAIHLVNGHPQSGWTYDCRKAELDQVFDDLAAHPHTLISGDWNLDPFHDVDISADDWVAHVGEGTRFHYHSGTAEHSPAFPTNVTVLTNAVLDHVASDFLTGTCATLGEAPGTARLDGGDGCDHRALLCDLAIPEKP